MKQITNVLIIQYFSQLQSLVMLWSALVITCCSLFSGSLLIPEAEWCCDESPWNRLYPKKNTIILWTKTQCHDLKTSILLIQKQRNWCVHVQVYLHTGLVIFKCMHTLFCISWGIITVILFKFLEVCKFKFCQSYSFLMHCIAPNDAKNCLIHSIIIKFRRILLMTIMNMLYRWVNYLSLVVCITSDTVCSHTPVFSLICKPHCRHSPFSHCVVSKELCF